MVKKFLSSFVAIFALTTKFYTSLTNGEVVSPYPDCYTEKIEVIGDKLPGLNVIKHGGDPLLLQDSDSTYMSCVDARTAHPVIASPAGDIGEFNVALQVYDHLCEAHLDEKGVHELLKKFVAEHTTPHRPFYMHTDDTRLVALLKKMGVDEFPKSRPANADEWFANLLQEKIRYHGCGHIWYQIEDPETYHIDRELIYHLLRSFFELLWDPATQPNIRYEVVRSTMDAHAVVVVKNKLSNRALRGPQCKDQTPPFTPRYCPKGCPADLALDYKVSTNGNISPEYDTFVLHASSANRHRQFVTSKFFSKLKCPKIPKNKLQKILYEEIEKSSEHHLEHTLHHLNATSLPFFTLEVTLTKP